MQTLEALLSKYLSESMDKANATEFPEQHAKYIAERLRKEGIVNEWISVKDRLPTVLKYDCGEPIQFIVMIREGVVPSTLSFNGKKWYTYVSEQKLSENYYYTVTHWMPLPKPPKENNDGQR